MILLDTCTLLWLARGEGLSPRAAEVITNSENGLFVSSISAMEIGTKMAKGKLVLPRPLREWWATVVEQHGMGEVPVEVEIAIASTQLPPIHGDPFDRLLIATARHLGATLLTPDAHIRSYPGLHTVWD